jgi:uncharacterized membrane protein
MFGASLAAFLLISLIVTAGMILLIVPGIIWAIQYMFALYIIADGESSATGAMRTSKKLAKGNLARLFLFGLAIGLFNLLGALACLVGVCITWPVSLVAMTILYQKFADAHRLTPAMAEPITASAIPAAPHFSDIPPDAIETPEDKQSD